jgi:two-component system, OmpR family, sensor histidine kinase KdpD
MAHVREPFLYRFLRFAAALGLVLGISLFYRHVLPVNPTTVALTFLLAILAVSTVWGIAVSVFMSVAAMLAFNYYFLPPVGKFSVADPQNWVALFAFLVVSVSASSLSTRARQKAEDASARRREIEKLYAFSQVLLESGNVIQLLNRIPAQIVNTFEVGGAALLLSDKQKVYRSGPVIPRLDIDSLKAIVAREEPVIDIPNSLCFVPVRLGVRPIGSLGISGSTLSRQTLEAIGTLIAVAVERARAIEQLGQTEAMREGERLRTALTESVTHNLRTPLTSIKASVTNLLTNGGLSDAQRQDLLVVINEESDRLNRLVGEAGEMARLDAGEVQLKLEPIAIESVINAALSQSKSTLGNRDVRVIVAPDLPRVRVDLVLVKEALSHLIENASQYSPVDQPITITAELSGDFIVTSVADRGSGIDDLEQSLIFEKFYRGKDQRFLVQGTGMGLPIAKAIVAAHGGSMSLTSQRGRGSVFSFTLPVDHSRVANT